MKPTLHGLLVIDKPAGWTSQDVCGWVRKWAWERKVGHAGTLDPAATGVLPIALNDGTKVLEYLSDADKAYEAEITFGVATDSGDIDGVVIESDDSIISLEQVLPELDHFRGTIVQVPPAHSAVLINGQRAYDMVRAGQTVDMPSRTVTISSLDVLKMNHNVLTVSIDCSKGTYIRSIARDLGLRLGKCAYMSNLVRTRSGPFSLADAWTIAELEMRDPVAEWSSIAVHPDCALPEWPSIVLDELEARDWLFGKPVAAKYEHPGERVRVYDSVGNWSGLAEMDSANRTWRALRVIGRP